MKLPKQGDSCIFLASLFNLQAVLLSQNMFTRMLIKNGILAVLGRILQLNPPPSQLTKMTRVRERGVHVVAAAREQEGRTPHGAAKPMN